MKARLPKGMGQGPANMQGMLKQAQKMQKDITKKKEEFDNSTFEGTSEWVTVEINGKKELQKVNITFEGTIEQDDKEMLEDMIMIAIKDAFAKIDRETENKLGEYASMSGLM